MVSNRAEMLNFKLSGEKTMANLITKTFTVDADAMGAVKDRLAGE